MDPHAIAELERVLKTLANANRLELLIELQEPKRVVELTLSPSRADGAGSEERAISRQAVKNHVAALVEIGVVEQTEEGYANARFVVNHARLFEVTERLRQIATVKPTRPVAMETRDLDDQKPRPRPAGAHFVLVRGVREGQAYPLESPGPSDGWLIGRRPEAQVRLDYDPFVSGSHARVIAREGRHFLVDLPGARNPTRLNWEEMLRGGVALLEPGDVVGVGLSLLVYRP